MRQKKSRVSCRKTLAGGVAILLLTAGLAGRRFVFAQESAAPTFDAQVRGREIVAHLNNVIQFYRASTQPIQKTGEPNDVVYRDQAAALSAQAAEFAFQSAKAEAMLIAAYQSQTGTDPNASGTSEQQKMQAAADNVGKRISDLQAKDAALTKQLAAGSRNAAALRAEQKQVEDALDLSNAMKDALQKIVVTSESQGGTGLAADIDRLQLSVPELQGGGKTVAPQLLSLDAVKTSGVTSQGAVLFELMGTRSSLNTLIQSNDSLEKHAQTLRKPITTMLRGLVQQGQQVSQQAEDSTAPAGAKQSEAAAPAAEASKATSITTQFKALSAASVPLSQEIIVLEQSRSNLAAWQSSVDREYKRILHAILLRLLVIGIALAFIIGGGEIWTRATNRYVRDIRRRRQFLIVRRVVVGLLSALVLLFGFVTQFDSLATFAGFITAGIAVGLQTILLSVAAYFFIIGRYGVKVGDRITISGVTGDVIDVGLVRFYMMELAGNAAELNPTGRIAVFSNAVLFQAGTPLYKQIPGTEYAWHELVVKFTDTANYKAACEALMHEVHAVYDGYRTEIEEQHRSVENWIHASMDLPVIESRLQFSGGAFQLWVRFPVQIRQAAETDEKLTQALLDLMAKDPEVKSSVAATPVIQASIRG